MGGGAGAGAGAGGGGGRQLYVSNVCLPVLADGRYRSENC
jgi:hypothetical protein